MNESSVIDHINKLMEFPFYIFILHGDNGVRITLTYDEGEAPESFIKVISTELFGRPSKQLSDEIVKFVYFANDNVWLWHQFGAIK